MHDKQLHGGKKTNLTKLAKGGYCGGGKMKAKKYNTGGELPQDKTDRIAREENKADRELVTKPARAVVEGVKRMYNAATGKGAKDFEPKTFTKAMGGPDDSGWEKYSQYTATDAVTTPVGGADAEMRPLNMGKKSKAYKASDFKQGGKVRGCGCAVKGKTKGRMV
jgi:hypothetical protein